LLTVKESVKAIDPVCGMDVEEKSALFLIHYEHQTIYFCSNKCKETYARNVGLQSGVKKKGVIARFLEKLAKDNNDTFGGTPPSCH